MRLWKNKKSTQHEGKVSGEISRRVESILETGIQEGASDIHIDPGPERTRVLYRIDGVFHTRDSILPEIDRKVITRIKLLARLITYRHDMAQEGRIDHGKGIDLRVSVIPTIGGEKLTIRVLNAANRFNGIQELGIAGEMTGRIDEILDAPQGLFLVSGPSGSGKTTTLYTCAERIRDTRGEFANIMSVEDPAERRLSGVHQVQVDRDRELDFPGTLKFLLRQDPEVILVGEIRDTETARVAVEAGLTGHLVLSSIHAGSSAEAFMRLVELGVDPRMVLASLKGIMAQRLVRKICHECAGSLRPGEAQALGDRLGALAKRMALEPSDIKIPDLILPNALGQGTGCRVCRGTGYRGRLLLGSLFTGRLPLAASSQGPDVPVESLANLERQCRKELLSHGIERLRKGETTVKEIFRVLGLEWASATIQRGESSKGGISCAS